MKHFVFYHKGFIPHDSASTGRLGETIAERYLASFGYVLLARNYRIRGGELDLIMEQGNHESDQAVGHPGIVFVEVKTRRQKVFGRAEDALSFKKKHKLIRTAFSFMDKRDYHGPWRLDLVAIDFTGPSSAQIRHYENVLDD